MSERAASRLDLICLGRAAVDLYGEQIGSPLEDIQSFAKSLGGCAANIAVGAARQGLAVGMITRVGDEHMGRFVRGALAAEGIDVSRVKTDPERLTGLVLLAVRDRETFPLIFYREDCADMALEAEDLDPAFIARARALLVTGTHFSTPGVDRASRAAIAHAKAAGTRVVLDVDYRPVLWKLTGHGAGEVRYLGSATVTEHLLSIVEHCDLVVGTEEEIHIAGGSTDTLAALRAIRARTGATIVMKRGPLGCVVFTEAIPARVEDGFIGAGVEVEVLNVLGAGDAFMSGFLRGWIRGEPLERATLYANACGALVVSRHGCAPAMPTRLEIDDYLARRPSIPRIDLDARLARLHRVTTRRPGPSELLVLAFDHRGSLEKVAARAGASLDRLGLLKSLIAEGGRRGARLARADARGDGAGAAATAGMIIDDRYGRAALEAMTAAGWWLARPIERPVDRASGTGDLELPGALEPGAAGGLDFEGGPNVELSLRSWPTEHVIKCLVFHHPEDPEPLRTQKEEAIERLHRAAVALDRELLLEVIPEVNGRVDNAAIPRVLERLYARGVLPDWWKLPPPADRATWDEISRIIGRADPYCRGVLLLGLDAPEAELAAAFRTSAGVEICRGFAVGRTIFGAPAEAWLAGQLDDEGLIESVARAFARMIALWRGRLT